MMVLTGRPRIAGILRAYASIESWLECDWDDSESVWHEFDDGRRVLHRARWRLLGRCAWDAASEQEALALMSDLQGTFEITPRTRAAGDPGWAEEITVLCRRSSRLPATRPIARRNASGAPVWRVELEVESCVVYPAIPGVPVGGFEVTSLGPGPAVGLRGTGGATVTPASATVTLLGRRRRIPTVALGTPGVVYMRTSAADGLVTILATDARPPEGAPD